MSSVHASDCAPFKGFIDEVAFNLIECKRVFGKKIRVLSSLRQHTRHSHVTQNGLRTVAAFRPWRGLQCSAAQDPAPGEAMKTHEL